MQGDHDPVWLTVAEGAARARVGRKLVYREVNAGRLRAVRVGGGRSLRFRPEWIDAWLETHAAAGDDYERPDPPCHTGGVR